MDYQQQPTGLTNMILGVANYHHFISVSTKLIPLSKYVKNQLFSPENPISIILS